MSNVDTEVITALRRGRSRSVSKNTRVEFDNPNRARVLLFGNCIATIEAPAEGLRRVELSHCGWRTVTTKARLNALCDALGLGSIHQAKFEWYTPTGHWPEHKPERVHFVRVAENGRLL